MTSEYSATAHPGHGKFSTWLNGAVRRHRIWLWVNLSGMAAASFVEVVGSYLSPYDACFPSPIGFGGHDLLAILIVVLMWTANTVAMLVGLVCLRDNTPGKRLTLLALWLLTPVCWILVCLTALQFLGPACCGC